MRPVLFDPGRARDAWGTLRGYVYQVDVTLERWLQLDNDEILELERGEDIDLLGRAATAGGGERDRLLEQVKHLEQSITLRSIPVRAFLANAHAHRNQNPSLALRFRFTTTAEPAVERPTTMPNGEAGIVVWERIRTNSSPPDQFRRALVEIRELLTSDAPPEGIPASTWAPFQDFVRNADDAELEAFLRLCEWSTRQIPATDYESQLHVKLVATGLAPDTVAAGSLYDRLFAYVFRVLTQPDVKQLTREALLAQVELWRRGVPLSHEDNRRVGELREAVRLLEDRVVNVESAVSELRAISSGSDAMIETLARQQGISAAMEHVAMRPVIEEPPLAAQVSPRHQTVETMQRELRAAGWLALHGVSGIGKSYLALVVAREASRRRVWIRFRDLAVAQAAIRLDAAMAQVSGAPELDTSSPGGWTAAADPRAALAELGRGAVVVLDDMPRYREGDDLAERLISLVRAAEREGVLVITTSPFPVPSAVVDLVGGDRVASLPAPPFSIEEVLDVLVASGAPDRWKEHGLVQLIHTVTRGHPTLIRACMRDLASRGWTTDMEAFGRVLGSDFAAGVNDETVRALIASAPNADVRELLFRLNLVDGEFTIDEVQLLAGVRPSISAPRAHLNPLLGLWVQSDAGGKYAV